MDNDEKIFTALGITAIILLIGTFVFLLGADYGQIKLAENISTGRAKVVWDINEFGTKEVKILYYEETK